jgi:hypothetical protein
VDLTPPSLRPKLALVKSLPSHELPLTFGQGHPILLCAPPEQLAIHPLT